MPTTNAEPTVHRLATLDRSHRLGGSADDPIRVLLVERYDPAMVTDQRSRQLTPGFEVRTTSSVAYGNVVYAVSQSGPEHVALLLLPIDGTGRWDIIDLPPLD